VDREVQGCYGKQEYSSRDEAERKIGRAVKHRGANRGELRSYRCPFCHYWHLGHRGKEK